MPDNHDITVGKHPCAACGGDMLWDARRQLLRCPYCGQQAAWAPAAAPLPGQDGIAELDLEQALASAGSQRFREEDEEEDMHQAARETAGNRKQTDRRPAPEFARAARRIEPPVRHRDAGYCSAQPPPPC